ncbi:MAG: fluoride efflux transporter CrcB [Anaerovoracaceae bacterium]
MKILCVGGFGFLGAIARYIISLVLNNGTFPYGTFFVNVLGCFLIVLIFEYFSKYKNINPLIVNSFAIGFVGAFTTFSTFSVETVNLMISGDILYGVVYVFGSMITGLIGCILGLTTSEVLLKARKCS